MAIENKFEKIKLGDTASFTKEITQDDVNRFVQLTGDDNPLHVNRSYALETPFKGIVVHGMLGASFISTIIGTKLPGEGALWVSQNFEFLLPVRLGDTLEVTATVTKKLEKENMIELDTKIINQNKAVVLKGMGLVKILEASPREVVAVKGPVDRIAILTGATGGIGSAIAARLASEGYKIVLGYHSDTEAAKRLAAQVNDFGGKAHIVRADLSNERDIQNLVTEAVQVFGGVSVLVNNASPRINPCKFLEADWEGFQIQINLQIKAAFLLMQKTASLMKDKGGGAIVNISSQAIEGSPTPGWMAYAGAKAGLASLTKYAAMELGPYGVRVNQVSPGMVDTPLIGDIPEKNRLMIARQTPLRRLATPEDVADAVWYLCSENSSHVTGETLRVNGGMVML
jgi:3-oxoacyl-[acyl-carrier protein] reductase